MCIKNPHTFLCVIANLRTMKKLIEGQILRIDDHKRGNKEVKSFDQKDIDVHLEKITKRKVFGKKVNVKIRAPLNSDKPISISIDNKKNEEIPRKLKKEIQKAFNDKKKRESLISEIENNLNNYESILDDKDKVHNSLKRLSKHFDLKWTKKEISTYANKKLIAYTEIYIDNNKILYYLSIDKTKVIIGELDNYTRHIVNLKSNT